MLKGISFLINEEGERTAVQIDLKKHGDIWEDFYDTLIAIDRSDDPRESIDFVRQRLEELGKLDG
ncbi:MAG: hypothetical protein ACWGO1_04585 [Anaerolineales bacterium]